MQNNYVTSHFEEQVSQDYPVSIYYVELPEMFMKSVRHHWHDKIEIDYVKSGSAIFSICDEEVTCHAGEAVVINSDQIHSIRMAEDAADTVILSLLFSPDYLFEDSNSFLTVKYRDTLLLNEKFNYCHFNESGNREVIRCIQSLLSQNLNKNYGYELMTKSLLSELWIQLLSVLSGVNKRKSRLSLSDMARAKDAIVFIHGNYSKALTLDEIASSTHLSKSECCRCFKRATHLTPFEYLMKLRIYESAYMMQMGDAGLKLSELATSVGFNNASYYNKMFRKYLGCTPTIYRENIKRSHRDALNPYGISM